MPRIAAALAGAALLLVVGSGPATAHASLVETDPVDGARVAEAPRAVSLTFSENIGNGFVAVTAPDGTAVETTNVRTVDQVLSADLAASDERGRYTVAYRIVSADGHSISGDFTFTTTTGRVVEQVDPDGAEKETFVHRHRGHLVLGLAIAVVAIGLILAPLRRGRSS